MIPKIVAKQTKHIMMSKYSGRHTPIRAKPAIARPKDFLQQKHYFHKNLHTQGLQWSNCNEKNYTFSVFPALSFGTKIMKIQSELKK